MIGRPRIPDPEPDAVLSPDEQRRKYAREWARHHYVARPKPPFADTFWSRVVMGDGCWEWQGTPSMGGRYGCVAYRGRQRPAHVVAWVLTHGVEVPAGRELDHLCRNRMCVRPDHLEPVTHQENVRRGAWGARRFVCIKGHGNKVETSAGLVCRECRRQSNVRYRRRLSGTAA